MNDFKIQTTRYITNIMFTGYSAELNMINMLVYQYKICNKLSADPRFDNKFAVEVEQIKQIKSQMNIDNQYNEILNCSSKTNSNTSHLTNNEFNNSKLKGELNFNNSNVDPQVNINF